MGDHRAEIKVDFTIHGKTYKLNLDWINYFDNGNGIDQRVVDFFSESWDDARGRFDAECAEYHRRQYAAQNELAERQQYAALKARFGD